MGITEWIAEKCANYDNPKSLGSRFRARRVRHLVRQIQAVYAAGRVRILDVGGRKSYWNIFSRKFLEDHSVHITILNLPCESQPEDDQMFAFVNPWEILRLCRRDSRSLTVPGMWVEWQCGGS